MIIIKRYSNEDFYEWNKFNRLSKNSLFMFDRNYMDYHSDRYVDHSLMFYCDNELVAILPASESDDSLVSHGGLTYGGFIVGNKMKQTLMIESMHMLKDYMKNNMIKKIVYKSIPYIYSSQPAEEDEYALYIMGAHIKKIEASTVVYLRSPLEMSKLRKRMIKKAIKESIVISEELLEDSYIDFIELQNKVLNKYHGVNAVHTAQELFLLHSRFPNNIRLVVARKNNEMIAGAILFEYDNLVHTQYLAANGDARKIGALDLVISSVIERYKNSKDWLDFGISTEKNGSFLNEGLISQKEGFGGRTVVYKTWELCI
jgi:hypothetical protein